MLSISNAIRTKIGEIGTVGVCCILILILGYFKHWIRYIIMIPLTGIALIGLCLSILPSYKKGPDIASFFQEQNTSIITKAENFSPNTYIKIQDAISTKTIEIQTGELEQQIPPGQKFSIQYISPKRGTSTQAFILTKNGIVIELFPQSSISLQGIYPNHMEIQVNTGEIAYTILSGQENTLQVVSGTERKETPQSQEIENTFIKKMQTYIKKQWGNPLIYTTQSIFIQKEILDIANLIFPQIYGGPRANFLAFVQSFPSTTSDTLSPETDTQAASQEIRNQSKKGRQETKIYQWLQTIFH